MAINNCQPGCIILPPSISVTQCNPIPRQGGIRRIVVASCDVPDLGTLTPEEICALVLAGKIKVSPIIVGEKPVATPINKSFNPCAPEQAVNYDRTLTFTAGLLPNDRSDYDFFGDLTEKFRVYQFGFITCDGWFHGWLSDVAFEVSLQIENSNVGSEMWGGGAIKWRSPKERKPLFLPSLESQIVTNCDTTLGTCGQIQTDFPQGYNISFVQDGSVQQFIFGVHGLGTGVVTAFSTGSISFDAMITATDFTTPGVVIIDFTVPIAAGSSTLQTTGIISTHCAGVLNIPLNITLEDPSTNSFIVSGGTFVDVDGNPPTIKVAAGATLQEIGAVLITRGSLPYVGEVTVVVTDIQQVAGVASAYTPAVTFSDMDAGSSSSTALVNATSVTTVGTWKYTAWVEASVATYIIVFYIQVV